MTLIDQLGAGAALRVPGDKSVTHRGLLFGALAEGRTEVRRPLVSADTRSTAAVLRQLGVAVPPIEATTEVVTIDGVGLRGLREPREVLNCGNSGTTARLLLGILAGQPISATMTGDASLRGRPMDRIAEPLGLMGARFRYMDQAGRLPLVVSGGGIKPIDIRTPVASAQIKSAIVLAGLTGGAFALVTEPRQSRDHTERLLKAMGVSVISHAVREGWRVELRDPPETIQAVSLTVPGDISTAAFPLVWAVCRAEGPPLELRGVGVNPTRTGMLAVLERMGARIERTNESEDRAEPTATLVAYPSRLEATEITGAEIPSLVDEIPALVIAGLFADGESRVTGAGELRVKESDRIASLTYNLRRLGVDVDEARDGLSFRGPVDGLSGEVDTFDDHRIEMAFGVLEALTQGAVRVADRNAARVSYPAFWDDLAALQRWNRVDRTPAQTRRPVVTIDGPAGSGKSTTARAVAAELGLVHLDSGALYRAIALALLEAGVARESWDALPTEFFEELRLDATVDGQKMVLSLGGEVLNDARLRTDEVTAAVSSVAALPSVRAALIGLQRAAGRGGGLVADGRDMGTVVFPGADVKIFLVADLEERARRRANEGDGRGEEREVVAMAQRLQARDFEDTHREHSPLRRPADAIVIDTTHLSPEGQLGLVLDEVRKLEGSPRA